MKDASTILEEFAELAQGRCAFSLNDGRPLEGYLLAVAGGRIRFGAGGPVAAAADLYFAVGEVDLDSLSLWDADQGGYLDARWDEGGGRWTFRRRRPAS